MANDLIEQAFLETLWQIDGFGPENTSRGDYNVLSNGGSQWIVVEYNGFEKSQFTGNLKDTIFWKLQYLLFIQDVDGSTSKKAAILRQAIMDRLQQEPRLGIPNNVFDSNIISGSQLPPLFEGLYSEELTCQIQEIR